MSFLDVTVQLLDGFRVTLLIFFVTLACAIPLGLVITFGSMSRFTPLRYLTRLFVWVIRGTPLMLQIMIVFYGPGLLFEWREPSLTISSIAPLSFARNSLSSRRTPMAYSSAVSSTPSTIIRSA